MKTKRPIQVDLKSYAKTDVSCVRNCQFGQREMRPKIKKMKTGRRHRRKFCCFLFCLGDGISERFITYPSKY